MALKISARDVGALELVRGVRIVLGFIRCARTWRATGHNRINEQVIPMYSFLRSVLLDLNHGMPSRWS